MKLQNNEHGENLNLMFIECFVDVLVAKFH